MAKIASCMAKKGEKVRDKNIFLELGNVISSQIMSKETWRKMHDKDTIQHFAPHPQAKTSFTQGGVHKFGPMVAIGAAK